MKKLVTILLTVVLVLGTAMLVACKPNETPSATEITQEAFMTELTRREAATLADPDSRYTSARFKFRQTVPNEAITFDDFAAIIFGDNYAYILVQHQEGGGGATQIRIFGCSSIVEEVIDSGVPEVLAGCKFYQNGDNLEFVLSCTYEGATMYQKLVLDAKGYSIYSLEREEGVASFLCEFSLSDFHKD